MSRDLDLARKRLSSLDGDLTKRLAGLVIQQERATKKGLPYDAATREVDLKEAAEVEVRNSAGKVVSGAVWCCFFLCPPPPVVAAISLRQPVFSVSVLLTQRQRLARYAQSVFLRVFMCCAHSSGYCIRTAFEVRRCVCYCTPFLVAIVEHL